MSKRFIAVLISAVLCLSLTACSSGDTQPESYPYGPILYEVSDGDGNKIWLFGSIHRGMESFYPLPEYIMSAFKESDALAVEMKSDKKENVPLSEAYESLIYTDGSTIRDHIDKDIYDAAVQLLTNMGMYKPEMDKYKPVIWSILIENNQAEDDGSYTDLGIDKHLIKLAEKSKKEILEIEGAEAQANLLASFSDEIQESLLRQSVAYLDKVGEEREILEIWYSGDEKLLTEMILPSHQQLEESEEAEAEYYKAMIFDRNTLMTDFAEKALKDSEKVFICVGTAHVLGEKGIAQMLSERGYTVTRLFEKQSEIELLPESPIVDIG